MLHIQLSKTYHPQQEPSFRLEISLELKQGITILFGPSGSGKTMTLRMISGIETPDQGIIRCGEVVFFDSAAGRNLPIRKRKVAHVFQDLALFPHLTVEENVSYGVKDLPSSQRMTRVGAILESFGIANLSQRRPERLSGGEQQRVALARALVTRPRVLLLDEPLSALDLAVKRSLLADLERLNQELQIPILYVTHDISEALTLGEHLVFLKHGRVAAQGEPWEILEKPETAVVARLLGVENILQGRITSVSHENGTMTCDLSGCRIVVPLSNWSGNQPIRIGLRSRDMLVSVQEPQGLSAQNLLPGKILSLESVAHEVHLLLDCGVPLRATLTMGAARSLQLREGLPVWAVFKSHSCFILKE